MTDWHKTPDRPLTLEEIKERHRSADKNGSYDSFTQTHADRGWLIKLVDALIDEQNKHYRAIDAQRLHWD